MFTSIEKRERPAEADRSNVCYSALIAPVMYCKPLRSFTANIGNPMGLARYARKSRINPFCQEYVARTVMPSRVSRKLANPKIREEQEIRPIQIQVNTSMIRTMGKVRILTINFILNQPLLYNYHTDFLTMKQGCQQLYLCEGFDYSVHSIPDFFLISMDIL